MSNLPHLEEFTEYVAEGCKIFDDLLQAQTDHPREDVVALADGAAPSTFLQKEMIKAVMGFVDSVATLRRVATARGYPVPFKFEDYQKKVQDAE